MVISQCPVDEDLWPAIVGDLVNSEVQHHLSRCVRCRQRVAEERESISYLRSSTSGATTAAIDVPVDCPSLSDLLVRVTSAELPSENEDATGLSSATRSSERGDENLTAILSGYPKLGKYRIVRNLSSGAQGTVLHAWHVTLNREVAIKVCRQALDAHRQSRIIAEGAMLAQINHPGLAQIYDLDVHEGRPYLVMEYVAGRNLRQLMQMAAPPMKTRLRIMHELLAAVSEAHRHGILHLDLKPENVMIDEQHHVKLIDFGMGFLLPTMEPVDRLVAGTFEYMAPEQLRGQMARWSSRTDVYGLGAVLFFLITGSPPVDTRSLRSVQQHDQTIREAIKSLSTVRGIGALQRICARALDPEPTHRFRDANAFDVALRRAGRSSRVAVCLIIFGTLGMLIPCLPETWFGLHKVPSTAVSRPGRVIRQGVRLSLEARCPLDSNLSLYVWLPHMGVVPFKGLDCRIEDGHKVYRLSPSQDVMSLYDTDWVIALAVQSWVNRRDLEAELNQLHEVASTGLVPPGARVKFGTGRPNDVIQFGPKGSLLTEIKQGLENAKINAQGVYVRSADVSPDVKGVVTRVEFEFP